MIVGLVLAGFGVIIIPIVAILAAIAIPQYQDYTARSKVIVGIAGARAMLPTIEAYKNEHGNCPDRAALGIGGGRDDRFGPYVSSVSIGANADGACEVELQFTGLGPSDSSDASTLTYRLAEHGWDCTGGTLPQRYRPNECRAQAH